MLQRIQPPIDPQTAERIKRTLALQGSSGSDMLYRIGETPDNVSTLPQPINAPSPAQPLRAANPPKLERIEMPAGGPVASAPASSPIASGASAGVPEKLQRITDHRDESIVAQPAPRLPRIEPRDFVAPVVDEGLRSNHPGIKRIALREAGVPDEMQDLVNVERPEPARPDHSKDKPRGFWRNLLHHLEHAGKGAIGGLAASGGNPIMALIGAAAGGIKPELADNLEHNTQTIPRWQSETKQRQANAGAKLERIGKIADLTGVDPTTGKPTLKRQQAEATNAYRQRGLDLREQDTDSKIQERERRNADRVSRLNESQRKSQLEHYHKLWSAGGLDEEDMDYYAQLAGLHGKLKQKFIKGQLIVDKDGNYQEYDSRSKTVTSVKGPEGKPVTSWQKAKSDIQQQQFDRRQDETERHNRENESLSGGNSAGGKVTRQQVFSVISNVQAKINRAKALAAKRDKGAAVAAEDARAAALQAQSMYGNHVEVGGLENNGIPYIKPRSGASGSGGQVQTAQPSRNYITQAQYQKLLQGKEKAAVDARLKAKGIEVK
jgi:hypothetical protein